MMSVLAEKESIFFKILICSNERKLKKLNAFARYFLKDEKTTWPNDDELDFFISYIEGLKLGLAEMRQQECEDMVYRDNVIDEINANLKLIHNPKQLNVILQWLQIGVEQEHDMREE